MSLPESADDSLLARAARRRTGDRLAAAEEEVRRILDAGLALMQESPGGSPRIVDIGRRAGVSNDAFYRAFRGKDELMAAIADDGARRLVGYVRHQRDKAGSPIDQVRAVVRAVLAQASGQVAVTTRAVLRNSSRVLLTGGPDGIEVRGRIADLLEEPLRTLGSPDPVRDARLASCAVFALMEDLLWAEREPEAADEEHVAAWIGAAAGRVNGG